MNENQVAHVIVDAAFKIHTQLADKRLGLLINFGDVLIKRGTHRIVNGLEE